MQSAGAGETALDRLPKDDPDKVNSIYTRRLLPLLKTPGLQLHELARNSGAKCTILPRRCRTYSNRLTTMA